MSLTKQISTIIKTKTITSVPWDNTWILADNGKRKVTLAMCLSLHYIERRDVKAVHLGVFARKPRVTEPYM